MRQRASPAGSGAADPAGDDPTGYNTRQVLNYGYTRWDQFFNDRQLLGIGLLSRRHRRPAGGC